MRRIRLLSSFLLVLLLAPFVCPQSNLTAPTQGAPSDPRIQKAQLVVDQASLDYDRASLSLDKLKTSRNQAPADAKASFDSGIQELEKLLADRQKILEQAKLDLREVEINVRQQQIDKAKGMGAAPTPAPAAGAQGVAPALPIGANGLKQFPDVTKYPRKAADLQPMAQSGDAVAQCLLGEAYLYGFNVTIDDEQAARWLRLSAAQEYPRAMAGLASMELWSYVIPRNPPEAVALLRQASATGDPMAVYHMAVVYRNGEVLPKEPETSARLFKAGFEGLHALAEGGDPLAQDRLGDLYLRGSGVSKDIKAAQEWYLKAAEQGLAMAQSDASRNLAWYSQTGTGTYRFDITLPGSQWLKKSADQGYGPGLYGLSAAYDRAAESGGDPAESLRLLRLAAELNYAPALNVLGVRYHNGTGVAKDEVEGLRLFRKAADLRLPQAIINVANDYVNGWGGLSKDAARATELLEQAGAQTSDPDLHRQIADDYFDLGKNSEGLTWQRKAAAGGDAQAQEALGDCLFMGEYSPHGCQKDLAEAFTWYSKAAEAGRRGAQGRLGAMYASGNGTQKDSVLAIKWFQKALDQKDMLAEYFYGQDLLDGTLPGGAAEGARHIRIAAEAGLANSQMSLADCYAKGQGVAKDPAEAYFWYSVALDDAGKGIGFNVSYFQKQKEDAAKKLNKKQIAEVDQRVRAWKPK